MNNNFRFIQVIKKSLKTQIAKVLRIVFFVRIICFSFWVNCFQATVWLETLMQFFFLLSWNETFIFIFQVIFHSLYCYPHSDIVEKLDEIFGRKYTSLVNRIHCFKFVVMMSFLRARKTCAKDLFKRTQSYCKNLRSQLKL